MKLISKTLLYYLLISLPLVLFAVTVGYYLISTELIDGVDEALWKEKIHIEKALDNNLNPENLNLNGLTNVNAVSDNWSGSSYSDRMVYDSLELENIKYRVITSYYKQRGQNYRIEIARPSLEEEELKEGILSAFGVIALFLIISFFFVSWLLSKTLWRPFYKTLEKLATYEIKDQSVLAFEKTSTQEFAKLNSVLTVMTQKLKSDFMHQKEFTENAAHEMQTPLSVIKANISLLIQSSHLTEEEMQQLEAIDNTTKKLASLNRALLLLAKIENNQFKETTTIDLAALLLKECHHVSDLIEARQIKIDNKISNTVYATMNPVLAEVLVTNLFQNAIRHNMEGGTIILETSINAIVISNTGEHLKINSSEIFNRFKKNEASKDSVGLGLAIVKGICSLYGIEINYANQDDLHSFILKV